MSWLIHCWYFLSLLVIKDCQGFFLRHNKSGKCIAAGSVAWKDEYALCYWAEMVDNCLDVRAQFRYSTNELLKNIETGGTLLSNRSDARFKNRFVLYMGVHEIGKSFEKSADNRLKQTLVGSLYGYEKDVCVQPSKIDKYVDEIKDGCSDSDEQKFTFGSVTKDNTKTENVGCSPNQYMMIKKVDYGDFINDGKFDFNVSIDTKCSSLTACKVKNLCGGNRSCELTVDSNLLSPYCAYHPAPKELYVEYTCVDTYNFKTAKASDIRLYPNSNEYLIQIKDVSAWRNVKAKNWDKNRQKMLCQHLGFNDSDFLGIEWYLGGGEDVATGDLICYNRQSGGTSCCIHFEPSTTLISLKVRVPQVRCKICDNPLDLRNFTTFPCTIFLGRNNDTFLRYDIVTWCGTGSGTEYLMMDLQKDYHITRVVTWGNREQTQWSGSYSLKFSHSKILVDRSNAVQITGNKNGYQASTTILDIYNVRYIKIKSTENQNFCLRIKLCGEVQHPGSVREIFVTPSCYSARGSLRLQGPSNSSYITHIDIYLKHPSYKEYLKSIFRKKHGNTEFEIDNLKPNTYYTVGVVANDGYSQRSRIIYKEFMTSKAEPVNPVPGVYYSLGVYISKPPGYIKGVMVVVQISTSIRTPSEDIETNKLRPYNTSTQDHPYIAAYLKTDDLPLTLVIGDGKAYNSEHEKYFNQPLKSNSSYIVFLRLFESKDLYYSTEWSSSVNTMAKRPVVEYDDNRNSEVSSDNKIRLGPKVPMVIVSFCFLLSLRVIVYLYTNQRRHLQKHNQSSHKPETPRQENQNERSDAIEESADNYESIECAVAGPEHPNDQTTYAIPNKTFRHEERNNTKSKPENSAVQEPSAYTSLKSNREAENFYQPLQPPTSSLNQHIEGDDNCDQTGQDLNSDYMSLYSNREAENFYQPLQPPTSSADQHTKGVDHRNHTMQCENLAFSEYSYDD